MSARRWLVIGCGNELRGDDGSGPRVARMVAELDIPGVKVLAVHQLAPELARELAEVDEVVFVDGAVGIAEMECSQISGEEDDRASSFSHTGDPLGILKLTRAVFDYCPTSYQVLIPVCSFEFGASLSPMAQRGLQQAMSCLTKLITEPR